MIEQIAVMMIVVSLVVLGVCFFHVLGVGIMRLWNQRTGRHQIQIVRRG
jgi:hypothetical protein